MGNLSEKFNVEFNFAIGMYDKDSGELLDHRRVHNVTTNTGRTWMSRLFGSSDYSQSPPAPHVTTKIKYMGVGVGGALQTDNQFANTQSELVTVTALEDPVAFSEDGGGTKTYLKQVDNQAHTSVFFPGNYRTVFIMEILESEVSYAAATTRISNVAVGTSVPMAEAGLYLSDAVATYKVAGPAGTDPATANSMVAYATFNPFPVTPNGVFRLEWEVRV